MIFTTKRMSFTPHLLIFDTLPTTMLEAKSRARAGAREGTTILARAQTSGRGRLGRTWIAGVDAGIWMTTILHPPPQRKERFAELSLVVGLAICESVRAMGVTQAFIKWPNDVLVGDRKLAGILLESDDTTVLAGIGINLAKHDGRDLPAAIAGRYTGVYDYLPQQTQPDGNELVTRAQAVLASVATWYSRWKRDGFAPMVLAYDAVDALKDVRVYIAGLDGSAREGTARGVNEHGELIVETTSGTVIVRAGEVERVRR